MNILAAKTVGGYLQPLAEYAGDLDGIGQGEIVRLKVDRPRNINFHRKYFAMIKYLWTMVDGVPDLFFTQENLRKWLQVRAGFYDEITLDGTRIALSISFGSMTEDEFQKVYTGVINVALKELLPKAYKDEDLDQAVQQFMGYF